MSYGSVRSSFSARRAFIQTLDADILWNNAGYGESGPVSEIATEIVERELPDPPYRRVMLKDFDALPASVRHLHKPLRDAAANGGAVVTGASSFAGRLIARLMRFPPPGQHPLHVSFREREGVERWSRDFGGYRFSSELRERSGMLEERFGPLRFHFDLPLEANGLRMSMQGWSAVGIPLPLRLAPRSEARVWDKDGVFHFDVPIALPLVGTIVHYRGWLRGS